VIPPDLDLFDESVLFCSFSAKSSPPSPGDFLFPILCTDFVTARTFGALISASRFLLLSERFRSTFASWV
jgi:hypothetical protein